MLLTNKKRVLTVVKMSVLLFFMTVSVTPTSFCQPKNNDTHGTLINRIVATVNDEIITQVALDKAVNQFKVQLQLQKLPLPNQQTLEKKILKQLIISKIALMLAKRLNITVSDDDVSHTIQELAAQNNLTLDKFKAVLASQKVDYKIYWTNVKTHMIIAKLQQQTLLNSLIVTPEEISAFLAEHKKSAENKQYNVSQILLSLPNNPTSVDISNLKQKAETLVAKINAGLSFAKAAIENSASENASQGGNLGWKGLNELPTFYVNPILSLKPGQIADPIKTPGGFVLIKLDGLKTIPIKKHIITQYDVSQILIRMTPLVPANTAKQIIDNLYASAVHGDDFATLAEANSKDSVTAQKGGSLGWVSIDAVDPTIQHVIENTPIKQVSRPFKVGNNWLMIKVNAKRQHDDTENFLRRQAQQTIFEQKAKKADLTWQSQIMATATVNILVPGLKSD